MGNRRLEDAGIAAILAAAAIAAREIWKIINANTFNPQPDPTAIANITLSAEEDRVQSGYLRQKGLLKQDESLIAFYNNALVSPAFGDDRTNTCLFVTEQRVVQVKEGKVDREAAVADIKVVAVEHNSVFSDDYVVLSLKRGTTVKMEVVRESVGNALAMLIRHLAKITG